MPTDQATIIETHPFRTRRPRIIYPKVPASLGLALAGTAQVAATAQGPQVGGVKPGAALAQRHDVVNAVSPAVA